MIFKINVFRVFSCSQCPNFQMEIVKIFAQITNGVVTE